MKAKYTWFRQRRYLHFDQPVGEKLASTVAMSPARVARHSFFPFLASYIITSKVKYNSNCGSFKSEEKRRHILYASHVDSHIYARYAEQLSSAYEKELTKRGLEDCVLAFRSLGKSNIHFARDAFVAISSFRNCSVVALDVTKFFDRLDHDYLKKMWRVLMGTSSLPKDHYAVYRSLTKYASVDKKDAFSALGISPRNPRRGGRRKLCEVSVFRDKIRDGGLLETNKKRSGIPQGSPISAVLSNIYMLDFDRICKSLVDDVGGKYYRYCDDILLITPNSNSNTIAKNVETEIKKIKLEVNTDKTEKRYFYSTPSGTKSDKPLQYLGFTFDGERTLIRSASLSRYSRKMKRGVRLAKRTRDKHNKTRINAGQATRSIYKRQLYGRYSHLGNRNFVRYGYRAAEIMGSSDIGRQLKPLWKRLVDEIKD